ncbi:MAG: redoxin domain-containing protein [Candidatus Bathyarchaeota archaeon]
MAKLRPGDAAPDFTLESVNMGRVSLKDYRGSRVFLVFGRYFGCPVCQHDFDRLLMLRREIGHDLKTIYLVQSSPESAEEYIKDMDVGFPVVPVPKEDGKYRVYDLYGVGAMGPVTLAKIIGRAREARKVGKVHGAYEGKETQSPGDFVIDEDGRIIRAHVGLFEADDVSVLLKSLG